MRTLVHGGSCSQNAMADDPGIALSPSLSNSIKNSLKVWIGFVQDLVEQLCKVKTSCLGRGRALDDSGLGVGLVVLVLVQI